MSRMMRAFALGLGACVVFGLSIACETSTHTSTRTYEYNDEPVQKRSESNKLDSEYKMQSEGEMTSPQ